jgi:hypothetical protein
MKTIILQNFGPIEELFSEYPIDNYDFIYGNNLIQIRAIPNSTTSVTYKINGIKIGYGYTYMRFDNISEFLRNCCIYITFDNSIIYDEDFLNHLNIFTNKITCPLECNLKYCGNIVDNYLLNTISDINVYSSNKINFEFIKSTMVIYNIYSNIIIEAFIENLVHNESTKFIYINVIGEDNISIPSLQYLMFEKYPNLFAVIYCKNDLMTHIINKQSVDYLSDSEKDILIYNEDYSIYDVCKTINEIVERNKPLIKNARK